MTAATEVRVPDIGEFQDVPIIEVHVHSGDRVAEDDPLITLESDKATMDVPSPVAGVVEEVPVKVGDHVSEGALVVLVRAGEGPLAQPPSLVEQQEPDAGKAAPAAAAQAPAAPITIAAPAAVPTHAAAEAVAGTASAAAAAAPTPAGAAATDLGRVHAGPSVRRLAREFGVDLNAIDGTGRKGRITREDLLAFLRGPAAVPGAAPAAAAAPAAGIPEIPAQDFSKFGPVETKPLSRVAKLSGPHLHRSWLNVPHVTHDDEADITELDGFRKELDAAAKADGYRVTLLAFLIKASVSALRQYPELNSSLSPDKDSLILKRYYNIGFAVDTPGGLVVPVIREADRRGIIELSKELAAVSARARDGKLSPSDMQGGTFTISSLGGIGGTGFTPIVNAPEVAILGVVRSRMAPVWNGDGFEPRLMLPLSLSYDHRAIDGALAARFTRYICHLLGDARRLVL